jgi:SpoVK/Ycf46/Vps4 family AAA+-type ATPase
MRSQLLICLERFRGIVIFATNFVESYDKAFRSRIRDVFFPHPDYSCRLRIWKRHLPPQLPLSQDVSPEELAKEDWLNGRDIKTVIIEAAMRAAIEDSIVDLRYLNEAIVRRKRSQTEGQTSGNGVLTAKETEEISEKVQETLISQS